MNCQGFKVKFVYKTNSKRKVIPGVMSSLRYFPNPMQDYPETEGFTLKIPHDYLKESINSMLESINENFPPSHKNASDGLYLGTAGVSYMYYHLSKIPSLADDKQKLLKLAVEYLKPSIDLVEREAHKKKEDSCSFILGNAGVYAVAAVVYNAVGKKRESQKYMELYKDAANICKVPNFVSCGSDELFIGRAGYIFGALWMSKELGVQFNSKILYEICKVMVDSGRNYAQRHKCPCPLMYAYYDTEYLGAAHGLCTILQALMSVPGYLTENPDDARDVKTSVDFLLSIQTKSGNFPSDTLEINSGDPKLVHWCHGAPGMIYLMAKAYLIWKEEKYVKSCLLIGDLVWERGLLKKGPGICHGVGGNGYVFLLLYRLTTNPKFLHRALQFAKYLDSETFKKKARTPDCPYSLYEGIAGTACFMADVLAPNQATFPFSDVFN